MNPFAVPNNRRFVGVGIGRDGAARKGRKHEHNRGNEFAHRSIP
jgi:hypothetical protein